MGNTGSSPEAPALTPEQLSLQLAERFTSQCFTQLELYMFRENFRALADPSDSEGGFLYWKESTLIQFLGLPNVGEPPIGSLMFNAISNLAAFPFPNHGPAILNYEALVKVVALLTGRYKKALAHPPNLNKLIFRAFAIHDRASSSHGEPEELSSSDNKESGYETDESEDLALFELTGTTFPPSSPQKSHAHIPLPNLRSLLILLLGLSPLQESQSPFLYADTFSPSNLPLLLTTVNSVLRSLLPQSSHEIGLSYTSFSHALSTSVPHLLAPLSPLISLFLFTPSTLSLTPLAPSLPPPTNSSILTPQTFSQLRLFLPPSVLPPSPIPLFTASSSGFSLSSLQSSILHWRAPSIFLISGTLLDPRDSASPSSSLRRFLDSLPPTKLMQMKPKEVSEDGSGDKVVFGAYIPTPWVASHKHPFSSSAGSLFQLMPAHEVYPASTVAGDYAYLNRIDGLGFGAPMQGWKNTGRGPFLRLGEVSLVLEHQGLEYAVFNHAGRGGSYKPAEVSGAVDERGWQARFEIDEIEIWGLGGAEEQEEQRKKVMWEEREAMVRRGINIGNGDIEADRALLEMAGLIGQNRSGGSMN